MKIIYITPILLLVSALSLEGQNFLKLGGMTCTYEIQSDSIEIILEAPTTGWLGIGFNAKNDIVGSDLLLFRIRENHSEGEDQFVRGFQDHPTDRSLGGTTQFRLLEGEERNGVTKIKFRIPLQSPDSFDFKHQVRAPFWLILAYSVSDDFDHHSKMRKHQQIQWKG